MTAIRPIRELFRRPAGSILALVTLLVSLPAGAHHGWSSFDTRYAYYVSGTVTDVYWGNPHSEVVLRVDGTGLPEDWSDRALPADAIEETGKATMASARPYRGERDRLELVLAGPGWMSRWGMDRPLEVGEKIEVVGFLRSAEDRELRPVLFWLANGQAVWQQLTRFPSPPEAAPGGSR